ncbi:phosphatidylinositolglycan-like protein [Tasmannia lanceolata]|uniref:phosphatidylinositolglycan-like protein n=1 Tax=Tasmannia lanceolata TaxID=3420 RepID=UPI004064AB42
MPVAPLSNSRYTYIHDVCEGPQGVDVHHIFVRNNNARNFLLYPIVLLLVAYSCHLLLVKELLDISFIWSTLLVVFLVKSFHWNSIKKESVVILPAFGVQLETHYRSGRVKRRFVPIGKILKPVLNECVTPVTCYWSLALIIHGEAELMLIFQELRPPVKMMVPVWKALCSAMESKECADRVQEAG